jgi:hypothetical protein
MQHYLRGLESIEGEQFRKQALGVGCLGRKALTLFLLRSLISASP